MQGLEPASQHQLFSTFYKLIRVYFHFFPWAGWYNTFTWQMKDIICILLYSWAFQIYPCQYWICCLHLHLCSPHLAGNHHSAMPFPSNFPTSRSILVWASTGLFSRIQYASLWNSKGFLKKAPTFWKNLNIIRKRGKEFMHILLFLKMT